MRTGCACLSLMADPPQLTMALSPGDALDGPALAGAVGLSCVPEGSEPFSKSYLDTFDGRVFRSGRVLILHENVQPAALEWHSVDRSNGERAPVKRPPRCADDLPSAAVALRKAVGVRALGDVLAVRGERHAFRMLDSLEKTVARLTAVTGRVYHAKGEAEAPTLIRVVPFKGFEWAGESIEQALLDAMPGARTAASEFEVLAGALHIDPRGYEASVALDLEPSMPGGAAAAKLFGATYETMLATLPGARAAIDSEFLHDFRVAVRRSRAWLSRLKDVLDVELLQHMKQELGWLAAVTGPVRDLDVYLLLVDGYRAELPEQDAAALGVFEQYIRRQRRTAQRRLVRALDTDRFSALMRRWPNWLKNMERASVAPAREPVIDVASRALAKQCKRVSCRGRAITPSSAPGALQELRIECKKLHYLLEAFGSLYEAGGTARLTRGLKRLQDNLGDLHDFEVQSNALRDFANQIAAKGGGAADTQVAMGRLVERLGARQQAERIRFAETWSRFESKRNRAFMKSAFAQLPKRH